MDLKQALEEADEAAEELAHDTVVHTGYAFRCEAIVLLAAEVRKPRAIPWIAADTPPEPGRYGRWDVFLLAVQRPGTEGEYYVTGHLDPRGWFDIPADCIVTRYAWIAALSVPTAVGQLSAPPK
jgi:hypothetical protein